MYMCLCITTLPTVLQTRHKVLVSAFLRPLKDPFPPARCAGIGAMATTHTYYTTSDIASRLLPALCSLTVDKEKTVRDQVSGKVCFVSINLRPETDVGICFGTFRLSRPLKCFWENLRSSQMTLRQLPSRRKRRVSKRGPLLELV